MLRKSALYLAMTGILTLGTPSVSLEENHNSPNTYNSPNAGLENIIDNRSSNSNSSAEKVNPALNVLINPGHGPYGTNTKELGTKDGRFFEFDAAMYTSEFLRVMLAEDPRFHVEQTKDWTSYRPELINFMKKNKRTLQGFMDEKIHIVFLKGQANDDPLSAADSLRAVYLDNNKEKDRYTAVAETYAERMWGEKRFDIILNIHFNYNHRPDSKYPEGGEPSYDYPDSGYCVMISPYNKQFKESMGLALSVGREFSKISNPSTVVVPDGYLMKKYKIKDDTKDSLRTYGIVLRRLPQLGNKKNAALKPVLTIECEHLKRLRNDDYYKFYKYAEAIYNGIVGYYSEHYQATVNKQR